MKGPLAPVFRTLLVFAAVLAASAGLGTAAGGRVAPAHDAGAAGASAEATPTAPGAIAFARLMGLSVKDGDYVVRSDIYVVRTDGTGLVRLTTTGDCSRPAWSPDGRRIAFIRQKGFKPGAVWVMGADGSGKQRVVRVKKLLGPGLAWSPGAEILFSNVESDDVAAILAVAADGSGLRHVTPAGKRPTIDSEPAWAPDGRVFFARVKSDRVPGKVCAVAGDGSGETFVTAIEPLMRFSLSPDGQWLLLWSRKEQALVRVPAGGAGDDTVLLDDVARYIPQPFSVATSWAPGGGRIAFASGLSVRPSALYTVGADGSAVTKVPNVTKAFSPAWRPE